MKISRIPTYRFSETKITNSGQQPDSIAFKSSPENNKPDRFWRNYATKNFLNPNLINNEVYKRNLSSLERQREIDRQNQIQQDKNDYLWAKSWNPKIAKDESDRQAEKEINLREKEAIFYLKNRTKELIRNKYNCEYIKKYDLYEKVMNNISYYEKLFKDDIKTMPRSLSEIMKNTKGTLTEKIAGYSGLKRDMHARFVTPVTQEMLEGGERQVANSILLCGPTGCGKTVIAEAIANETYCHIDRINTDTNPDNFCEIIESSIKKAQIRYYEKQVQLQNLRNSAEYKNMTQDQKDEAIKKIGSPRSVIIIDEFDRYFNPLSVEQSTINSNRDAVKLFFDGCAKLPTAERSNSGAAVTFVCTTNYPARIPLGDFNTNKVQVFGVFPPSGQDMEDVIRYYMRKGNALIREYRKISPNLQEINPNEVNLKKFVKRFEPTEEEGAFSNDAIRDIILTAVESYIDEPDYDFNVYLIRGFKNSIRDIRPDKLKKYTEQLEKIHLKQEEQQTKIDPNTMSEKEVIQKRIENLTEYGEEFLMPAQLEELNNLRAKLGEIENRKD